MMHKIERLRSCEVEGCSEGCWHHRSMFIVKDIKILDERRSNDYNAASALLLPLLEGAIRTMNSSSPHLRGALMIR